MNDRDTKSKKIWESVYSDRAMTLWQPPEGVVQFAARFLKKRLNLNSYKEFFPIKRLLDIGCGNGATAIFFAKQDYEVFGVDLSGAATEIARKWSEAEHLNIDFRQADAAKLPFKANFFDCVVSYGVLDHLEPETGRHALDEAGRVLRTGGLFFLTLADIKNSKYGRGKKVAHNTYCLDDGYEAGAVQHYFDESEIKEWLRDKFVILDIRRMAQQKLNLEFQPLECSWRWYLTLKKIE